MKNLSDVALINPKFDMRDMQGETTVSFVPMAAISEITGTVINEEDRPLANVIKGFTPFLNGDILVAKITPCFENGKIALAQLSRHVGFGSTEFHVVRPLSHLLDTRYAFHFLRQPGIRHEGQSRMTGSAGQKRVPKTFLDSLEIPLPPLAEQKRIAAILDEASSLRRKRHEALEKLERLLEATFVSLFHDFQLFPKVQLRDVCGFITKGTTPKPSELHANSFDGAVPFLKVYNISDNGGLSFHQKQSFISSHYHNKELSRSKVFPGDVLMNIVGPPLGKIGLVPSIYPEWNINQAIAIFRPKEMLNSWYLLHILRDHRVLPEILKQAVGIRQLNLSLEQCRSISIPLPPIELQQKFAKIADELHSNLSFQIQSLDGLSNILTAMQDEYFSVVAHHLPLSYNEQTCLTLDF